MASLNNDRIFFASAQFSVRSNEAGLWCVYERDNPAPVFSDRSPRAARRRADALRVLWVIGAEHVDDAARDRDIAEISELLDFGRSWYVVSRQRVALPPVT